MNRQPHSLEMAVIEASVYTDWHIDVQCPSQAVLFPGPRPVPEALYGYAEDLAKEIVRQHIENTSHSFIVVCHGVRYRTQHQEKNRYSLRTLKERLWPIKKLGLKKENVLKLLSSKLRSTGGLVLVSGPTGSGKTTTTATVIGERLGRLGGYCLALEDPPEEPLHGWHGKQDSKVRGYCEQIQIKNGDYRDALVRGLRCFPSADRSILYLGEVRSTVAAVELLRIAIDGHLVFSTIHSAGITEALQRLVNLAREDVGEQEARHLLANSLQLCVHQRRDHSVPQVTMLEANSSVRGIIRNNELVSLQNDIATQNKPKTAGPVPF